MQCEVCGRRIAGKTYKAIIEGARLVVCSDCAVLGSFSWEVKPQKPARSALTRSRKVLKKRKSKAPRKQPHPLETSYELVDDFGSRIRQAREIQGLTHEDLGKKMSEKVSVLKKLESYKMTPSTRLAEKLQHALRIKLLVPVSEERLPKKMSTAPPKTITLGDLIKSEKSSEATK